MRRGRSEKSTWKTSGVGREGGGGGGGAAAV